MKRAITWIFQWIVGCTFLFGGVAKAIDPVGSSIKVGEYLQHFGMGMLSDVSMAIAWVLAFFEFALGFYVVIGRHRLVSGMILFVFMIVMTPFTLYLAIFNPVEDCGCFGDALVISNWATFWKNVALLGMVVWLHIHRYIQVAFLPRSFHTVYFYVEAVGLLILMWIGTQQLPYIDFRPYRPGVAICPAASVGQEDNEYVIVYQKEGIQREFSLENIPDEDSGWEFVETRIVESQSSSATDSGPSLVLFDENGKDVSHEVLNDSGYVMLLLSPSLTEADEHDIDRIENLYEYALEQGYSFYGVTLKDESAIEYWKFHTGSEYQFLYADQQVIETIIRSNPGFVLLHDGIILWKSHLSGIDVPRLTSAKLSEQSLGQIQPINRKKRVFWIIVWLIAPFLLYLPLQIINIIHNNKIKK